MTTKEKIEVMQAYEDGKTIEAKTSNCKSYWIEVKEPVWNWDMNTYRVKPEPFKQEFIITKEITGFWDGWDCFTMSCHQLKIPGKFKITVEEIL